MEATDGLNTPVNSHDSDGPMDGQIVGFSPGLQAISHTVIRDPAVLCEALNQSAPIRYCRSLVAQRACLHRVGYLTIDKTVVVSHTGTDTDFLVEDNPNLHLLIQFDGQLKLSSAGGAIILRKGGTALLPTGLRRCHGSHSLASVSLETIAVARAAAAMAGSEGVREKDRRALQLFEPPCLDRGPEAWAIHSLLHHIDACEATGPQIATRLGLDDVLHRLAAGLLRPELLSAEPSDLQRYRDREGRSSFDSLIDYMRANLDQPLRLSDLETRSHYSRRALQYTFRERLNCTPRQWIREQRLARALSKLQGGQPRPSVQAVALACGYRHMSLFAKDFRERFGISPSEARRR